MRFIFILLILLSQSLFSQEHIIQITTSNNETDEYTISEIENITFELDNNAIVTVVFENETSTEIELNNTSEIYIKNMEMVFSSQGNNNQNEDYRYDINSISSLEFETVVNTNPNRYPFGELEVDEIIINGLNNPWSIDFIDNNTLIFTELAGGLFIHDINENSTVQVSGTPIFEAVGQGGMIDVTLHPDFNSNKMVYLAYSVGENWQFTTAVGRGTLNGDRLENFEEIFRGSPLVGGGVHFGSRIIFDENNKLYFSIGDRGDQNNAQDSTNHYGSVMRINDDGTVPDDNPNLDAPSAKSELYTMGNRNIQGMFYLEDRDEVWAVEHGPRGGDELNLIQAGENYAWPLATYGINYDGSPITDERSIPGYIDPITYWVPSIAPCGMELVNYDAETNELDILITTLSQQHLHRIRVRDYEVVETVRSLEGYARFRDVQLSPDGYLYAATQGPGRIIRLKNK